jgi:hypothetical protein
MHTFKSRTTLLHAGVAIILAACGGSNESDQAASLFDADGQPSAAARQQPADSPSTRGALYATPAQYAWEALVAGPYTVLVDLDTFASPAAALAKALSDHEWAAEHQGVSHFVRGGTPEQAAAVADGLSDAQVTNVFLIGGADVPGSTE